VPPVRVIRALSIAATAVILGLGALSAVPASAATAVILGLGALSAVPASAATAVVLAFGAPAAATASAGRRGTAAHEDSHPRLLFTPEELPALREKVRDGGRDDAAYADILDIVGNVYPAKTLDELFLDSFGIDVLPNTGVAAFLETPADTAAVAFGRRVTLYLAETYGPDDNTFYSPLRMRALAFGYDMFFAGAPDSARELVRAEIVSYIDSTLSVFNYRRWLHSPYLSNLSAMIGSALGIAALCLENEIPSDRFAAALAAADSFVAAWHEGLVDPQGSYHEGAMYAGWSTRNLAHYFWARKRLHDRFDYSSLDKIRGIERWIAYSLLPIGGAAVNNVNDAAYLNYPLSRHHTYLDWAQTAWDSGLSAWLWERIVGPVYGHESGILADKTATVLWHRPGTGTDPGTILPRRALWRQHGLYYFRTGWPAQDESDDVVFGFYSGKFRGGHAQEDQNNFTLYGYGVVIAADNGFGRTATETEAHNLILIDDRGQHNAGSSVGTDGDIREHMLTGFADYLLGDATSAYTTYSEFNRPGYPFPDDDWSYGYDGGNPVEFARRRVVVVHGPSAPPYFVIDDEIRKDSALHRYSWRLHTAAANEVDASANPIRISAGQGAADLFVLDPPLDSLSLSLAPFDNRNEDPNTTVISLSREAGVFRLCCLLFPHPAADNAPDIAASEYPWGAAALLAWPDGVEDLVIVNRGGVLVECPVATPWKDGIAAATDARFAVVRFDRGEVSRLFANEASVLVCGGVPYASIEGGKASFALSGDTAYVDRRGAAFRFYAPRGGEVLCEDEPIRSLYDGGFLVPDRSGSPAPSGALGVRSFPNPFNSEVSLVVSLRERERVRVAVYDVEGRFVAVVWEGELPEGSSVVRWRGTDGDGDPAATGVYFVKAETAGSSASAKVILLK
jgi:hypothetical protein